MPPPALARKSHIPASSVMATTRNSGHVTVLFITIQRADAAASPRTNATLWSPNFLIRAHWELRSELRAGGGQLRGVDAFALHIVHRQVALVVKLHRPDSVVVGARPSGHRWLIGARREIARNQLIYHRLNKLVRPRQQHGLIGEFAASEVGEEKITG